MDKPPKPKRPPRFLLAMPDELRGYIERAASINGRTVTAEIVTRLQASLSASVTNHNPYTQPNTPTVVPINDHGPAGALADTDRAMLEIFRKMPVEKQLALLSLFR